MPLPDPASRARLAEMGIQVWVRRVDGDGASRADAQAPIEEAREEARVRLAAGDGAWLLVQRRPWDGRHAELLADLQAALRPQRCRFGQWADSLEAGHALSELPGRGVAWLLSFGPPPTGAAVPQLIQAPLLDELANRAEARRALWQLLRPRLSD